MMEETKTGSSDVDLFAGWMPEDEMAVQRKVTPRTLRTERARGDGPPWVRINNRIYYSIDGFRAFLNGKAHQPVRSRRAS